MIAVRQVCSLLDDLSSTFLLDPRALSDAAIYCRAERYLGNPMELKSHNCVVYLCGRLTRHPHRWARWAKLRHT